MSDDWPTRSLYDLATYQNGRAFKPQETQALVGRPVIKIAELTRGITATTGRYAGAIDERHRLRPGDLLFAWSGTITITRWRGPEAALNQHIFRVSARDGVDQRFLEYLLRSQANHFQRLVDDRRTTMGHVTVSDLKRMIVKVPPEAEQRRIARVLGALDDKIEANTRQARLIRELAEARWKLHAQRADVMPLEEVVEVGLSGVWGQDRATDSASREVVCLRGRDLEDVVRRQVSSPPRRWLTARQISARVSSEPEIWTAGSGSLGPSLLISDRLRRAYDRPLLYSNFVKRLVARPGMVKHLPSAWFAMLEAWRRGDFAAFTTGTAMPNLDPNAMLTMVSVPVLEGGDLVEVAELADLAVDPALLLENEKLTALRDALLPPLLSGELTVRDAESVVTETV